MFKDENANEWQSNMKYKYKSSEGPTSLGETSYLSEIIPNIASMQEDYNGDIDWDDMSDSLSQQVNEELEGELLGSQKAFRKRLLRNRILKITGATVGVFLCSAVFLLATKPGRKILYSMAGDFIYSSMDTVEKTQNVSAAEKKEPIKKQEVDNKDAIAAAARKAGLRYEKYVTNFLIFGIEQYQGAKNTDSMIIASINTKDKSIKLTSLMRDTYIDDIPGRKGGKLNSVYATCGADGLIDVVQKNYKIYIDGYASIDYTSFRKIIDNIGGIKLELGVKEAAYLNEKNYISNKANRNVKPGWNHLNGDQVLGYCRVRKVPTLEGVNDDYGRTLRQRKALEAVFAKYKNQGMMDLLNVTKQSLHEVTTNVSSQQIQQALEDIVENGVTTLDSSFRVPVYGMFTEEKMYNGVPCPLVLDWEANIKELYKHIYLDKEATPTAAPSAAAPETKSTN